jgi:sodium-dependent dicarboxylate transporter 2/3/5
MGWLDTKRVAVSIVIIVLCFLAYNMTAGSLNPNERAALVILIAASGFWTTEAVPLVATSLLIPLLQSILEVQEFQAALAPFFDPVIMLLLGGFLLAVTVEKYDLDEFFAHQILARIKTGVRGVVLVVMMITGFLSMWISNTAAAALMITLALKITQDIQDEKGNFSKIMVLAVAYSATAGGLSTLVGTTTCAMAAASIKDLVGVEITFLGWVFYGLPITVVMILVVWVLLFTLFPTDVKEVPDLDYELKPLTEKQKHTLIIFVASILAWFTSKLPLPIASLIGWSGHGYSSSIIAAMIAVALFYVGLLDQNDIRQANWSIILLIGGGLSLGKALEVSGLVIKISELLLLFTGGGSPLLVIGLVTLFGLGISVVASNTASAGIFLPIAIGLGKSTGINPVILAVAVGISTSLDFMLPVGTPPNAIAYSTGKVSMGEMIKAGFILDLLGAAITILLAWLFWPILL